MALILAIEPDRHQAAQIAAIAQGRIGAELVLAESAERALRMLGDRVPDLILTPQLLSPRDDAAITDRLRELGTAATFVQTLTIPALASAQPGAAASSRGRGLLSALRRQKAPAPSSNGCAPDVFAEQIAVYLERALEARKAHGNIEPTSAVELAAMAPFEPAPLMLDSIVAPASDLAPGFGREEPVSDVASGFSRKEPLPLIEPERPARVDAPVPAVDCWEPWQPAMVSVAVEEPVSQPAMETTVLMEPSVPLDVVTPPIDLAILDLVTPLHVATSEQHIPIDIVQVELVAPVEVSAPVEAVTRTTDTSRHGEEPLGSLCDSVPLSLDHGSGHYELRRGEWPVEVTAAVDVPEFVWPAATGLEPRIPIESRIRVESRTGAPAARSERGGVEVPNPESRDTAPAWTETDLTELVDAIAEPVVEPAPEIVETPPLGEARGALSDSRMAQPVPAARVPDAPAAAPPRPKAAKPANRKRRARPAPKDDWRFFDPDETRFAALLAKLDEITSTDAASHSPRPRA
jgi:hypothetical protein